MNNIELANDLELKILAFLQDEIQGFNEAWNSIDNSGEMEEKLIDIIEIFLNKHCPGPCFCAC